MTKVFDRVKLNDVLATLKEKEVPKDIRDLVRDIYQSTKTRIKTANALTVEITIAAGISQSDSLSPMLFLT